MHKVYARVVDVVRKGRDSKKKRGTGFYLCIDFVFGMSSSRQGNFMMHMGVGVEGAGTWALVWRLSISPGYLRSWA